MATEQVGAMITVGPSDWQIMQQDAQGVADVVLSGRWVGETSGKVEVRLVHEDTGVAVSHGLDWQAAVSAADGTWEATLTRVPAGGLYRLETRFNPANNLAGEWSTRGDMRHFLGVGDLWVIAGQSNSAGYGRGPAYDPPELGIHLFRNSERWALATQPLNESTDTAHPANREAANSGHSPYLHFARLLKQQLGHPIGLVQTALGGSPLDAWNPTQNTPAVLFQNMVHCVNLVGGRVKGILWYQGESDTGEALAGSYAARFAHAVGVWREALHDPGLAVLTVQLNRHYFASTAELERGWSLVREAQRQIAMSVPGVAVAPSFDLSLSDGIHTSPAGNMLLAERLARAALGMVYGRAVDYLAPDVVSARASSDGSGIALCFQPVTSRMDCIDPLANCFRVEDAAGVVPIDKVVYPGNATVQLVLGRALSGPAVVHGAYGMTPATVPVDMERFIPMLGFYGCVIRDA